jgi:probable rRNA maturation factor
MSEPPSSTGVAIAVSDEQHDVPIDTGRWARLATSVLEAEGQRGELTLTFVDADEMAQLNLEHMGKRGPTDVLSFPLDSYDDESAGDSPLPIPVLLGDVVICPVVAEAAAPEHAGTLDDELALLVVHGILHVLGHDHAQPEETALMRARERELLVAHHWHGRVPAGFRQEQS